MKKVCIIQTRMSSSRLPGKALLPIGDKTLTQHVIEKVFKAKKIDQVVIATSDETSDDILVEAIQKMPFQNLSFFRGSLKNVQSRFFDAAKEVKADIIIRITGDNPLIEPSLIDLLIERWEKTGEDYLGCSDCITGLGGELFTMTAFRQAMELSKTEYEQEHVTPTFYQNPKIFKLGWVKTPEPFNKATAEGIRELTLDTQEDYEFFKNVFEKIEDVTTEKVIEYLRKSLPLLGGVGGG